MPQGLPKKIEVALLLPDLALKLGDPPPCRLSVIEQRTAQRRPVQPAAPRPTRPTQRFQPAPPSLLLPLIQPAAIDLQIPRNLRHRLAGRNTTDGRSLQLSRYV
jgi:hypothetical protein